MPDKGEQLYQALKANPKYKNVGKDYQSFKKHFSETENAKQLYNAVSKDPKFKNIGEDVESFVNFFGLTEAVKKKVSTTGSKTGSKVGSSPDSAFQGNGIFEESVDTSSPAVLTDNPAINANQPTIPLNSNLGLNGVPVDGLGSSLSSPGGFKQDITDNLTSKRTPSEQGLDSALSAYSSAQGEEAAQEINNFSNNRPDEQVSTDTENVGSRTGYIGNKLLQGIGSLANGLVDIGLQVGKTNPLMAGVANDAVIGHYRRDVAPIVRDFLKDRIGFEVDKGAEVTYNNEFVTSAIGGLAQSTPAMLRGYSGLLLQGYDFGVQAINNADPDGLLDEDTKTIYASGLGLVTSALEKVGLDKIMKGNTTILSKLLFDKSVREAAKKSGGKITGDILEQYINDNVKGIAGKFAKGGARAVEGFMTEFTTGASQEVAAIASEDLLNKTTGQPIFDTSESSKWDGFVKRVAYAGAQEGVGGFIMGPMFNPGRRQAVKKAQETVQKIDNQLTAPNIQPETAEALTREKISLQEQIEQESEAEAAEQKNMSSEALKRADEIDTALNQAETALADPELDESLKPVLEKQVEDLTNELEFLQNSEKASAFKPNDLVNYTDQEGNVSQVPVESINGDKVIIGVNQDGLYKTVEVQADQLSAVTAPIIQNEQEVTDTPVEDTIFPEQEKQTDENVDTEVVDEEAEDKPVNTSKSNNTTGFKMFHDGKPMGVDMDESETLFIKNNDTGEVTMNKGGYEYGYSDPRYYWEPLFNINFDLSDKPQFEDLVITPAKISDKGGLISKGSISVKDEANTELGKAEESIESAVLEQATHEPKIVGNTEYPSRPKIAGRKTYIRTPDGEKISGTYKVVSADDILASHNEVTFAQTENFPTTESGTTVNDRDYGKDKNAQGQVVDIASNFDGRAISDTPIVDANGIVLSGNNRTMSRKLAASNKTDGTYLEELADKSEMFGVDPESIKDIPNPILVFEPKEAMPHTTETFAKFNKSSGKEKGPIERAVEISKTINDKSRRQISSVYEQATKQSDITSDPKNATELKNVLVSNNILSQRELPRYYDIGKNVFTKEGVSFLENMLMGGALNESSLRALDAESMGDTRRKIVGSVVQLTRNSALGKNSLSENIANAIEIANRLKKSGLSLQEYISQGTIFGDKKISKEDFVVAHALINEKDFKGFLNNYNENVGVADIFSGKERDKTTIADDYIDQKYGKSADQIRQNITGNEPGGSEGSGGIVGSVRSEGEGTGDRADSPAAEQLTAEQEKINKQSPDQDAKVISNAIMPVSQIMGGINKLQERFIAQNMRKVEDWIAATLSTWTNSKTLLKRNVSHIATSIFNGIPRSQQNLTSKLQLSGGFSMARHRASQLLDNLYSIVDNDLQSLENIHQVIDPDIYEGLGLTPLGFDQLSSQEQALYTEIRNILDGIHRRNFALGFIDKLTYDKFNGIYSPRMYETNEIPDDVKKAIDSQEKYHPVTKLDLEGFKARKEVEDLSESAKSDLLKDPVYGAVKRLMQLDQNAAIASYINQVSSSNPELVKDPSKDVIQDGYVLMSGKGYGKLDGKYVPHYIAEDFKGFHMMNETLNKMYDLFKAYDRVGARQFLKKSYTVFNPVVQLGNFISNFTFAFSAGIDPITFAAGMPKAYKALVKQGKDYETLLSNGILGNDIVTADLMPLKAKEGATPESKNLIVKAWNWFDEKTTKAYGMSDEIAKMTAYLTFKEQGFTEKQAIQKTYEGFQNYATVGKMWDTFSKAPVIGNPFLKFQADLQRIIKNGVTKTPLTTAMYLASLNAIPDLLQTVGLAEEEKEKDEELRTTRNFIPKIPLGFADIPLVYKTKFGEVNLARYLSPFYLFDTTDSDGFQNVVKKVLPFTLIEKEQVGKGNKITTVGLSDPLLGTFASAMLTDTDFRGKSIQDPESTRYRGSGVTAGEQVQNKLTYLGRSWIPQGAQMHDFYLSQKYGEDFYGRTRTTAQSLMNMVVKVQDWKDGDYKKEAIKRVDVLLSKFKSLEDERKNIVKNLESKADNALMDLSDKRITKEQGDRRMKDIHESLRKRLERNESDQVKTYKDIQDFIEKYKEYF